MAKLNEVLTEGTLGSRKHINLPGVHVRLPSLTEKDLEDIETGLKIDVDFFALSFCREAKAVEELRTIIEKNNGKQKIIAKLEDQIGLITDPDLSAEYQRITVAAVGALQMPKIPIAHAAVEVLTEAGTGFNVFRVIGPAPIMAHAGDIISGLRECVAGNDRSDHEKKPSAVW